LKLNYDKLLSSLAFNFIMRHCNMVNKNMAGIVKSLEHSLNNLNLVGRCRLTA
jgi:hypothetical protein